MLRSILLNKGKNKNRGLWYLLLNYGSKLLILAGVVWVFYYQIMQREDLDQVLAAFQTAIAGSSLFLLICTILLVPVNWMVETFKWKMLLDDFQNLSLGKLYKAVLAGITISLFTPNRIGEYGGRVLFLPARLRWKGTMSTLAASFGQLIALIGFGIIALGAFAQTYLDLNLWVVLSAAVIGGLSLVFLLLSYFNLDLAERLLNKLPNWTWVAKAKQPIQYLGRFENSSLLKSMGFAALRYCIYGFQYYLLARFFGIEATVLDSAMIIGSIYLLQTSIPLPPIWSLLVRGQVALYFWGFVCSNPILILSATFGIWVINLIVPALVGMVFLMFLNIAETLGYETEKN